MSANDSSLQLRIGSSLFTASILDNPSASAFLSLLPLSLNMSDLHGNEKFADLSIALPTAAVDPGPIRAGDLMLYGSRTLVLWYEDYSNSYTYTRIGAVEDPDGLAEAVGEGEINIEFSVPGSSTSGTSPPTPTSTNNQVRGFNGSSYTRPLIVFFCLAYFLT